MELMMGACYGAWLETAHGEISEAGVRVRVAGGQFGAREAAIRRRTRVGRTEVMVREKVGMAVRLEQSGGPLVEGIDGWCGGTR